MHHQSHCIRDHNTHKDRNDLKHSFSPDIENNDRGQSDQRNEPVRGCIGNGGRCQRKTDADDDRTGYNRRQEMHNTLYAHQLDHQSQDQIQKTGYHDTTTGIGKLFSHRHICKDAGIQICNRGKAAKECKG